MHFIYVSAVKQKMATPYVQDTQQWVSFYMDQAESKVLDRDRSHLSRGGGYLTPVEKKKATYQEKPPQNVTEVNVELVSPIQQTVDQAQEEAKENPETEKALIQSTINNSVSSNSAIRGATSKPRDQLSRIKKL